MDRERMYFSRVKKFVEDCDVALEVVDARDIDGTRTKKLDKSIHAKIIMVAAKADLVPPEVRMQGELDRMRVVYFSSRTREGYHEILRAIRTLPAAAKRISVGKRARVSVFGMPNTGKSSLINVLTGRHSARTGFHPGVTRGEQWIKVGSCIMLCDTPGIVPIAKDKVHMVEIGAVEIEHVPDPEGIAVGIVEKFLCAGDNSLFAHYGVEKGEPDETLERIAKKRGQLKKGGEPNTVEAAKVLVRDFQRGKFVLVEAVPVAWKIKKEEEKEKAPE